MKRLVVIDGQGGRVGRQVVEGVLARWPEADLTAIGTNALATSAMIKGGARRAATGENAVIVACRTADIIVGPLGIVIADALLGEVTPAMAAAVGGSRAIRLLLPVNKCDNVVIGVPDAPISELLQDLQKKLEELLGNADGEMSET